ncbi:MAG: SIMPL domain-containing protein [Thiotrichales bacterium]
MRGVIAGLAIAVAIAYAGFHVGNAVHDNVHNQRFIEVRGVAERLVQADHAAWTLPFSVAGRDVREIMHQVARQQEIVKAFLVERGFKPTEIGQQAVAVQDNWSVGNTNASERYTGRAAVTLATYDVAAVQTAAQALDELLKADVLLDYPSIQYRYTALNDVKPAMLTEATRNARAAAESFASDSGARIVKLRSATQGLFSILSPIDDYDDAASVTKRVRVVTRMQYTID